MSNQIENHVYRIRMNKETGEAINERIIDVNIINHIFSIKNDNQSIITNNKKHYVDLDETPTYVIRKFDTIKQEYVWD